jgi:hypothetical protein
MIKLNVSSLKPTGPEIPDYKYGLRYLYENPEENDVIEEGGLNFSNESRLWIPNNEDSRYIFNDPSEYKIIDMKNYIDKYFINKFKDRVNPYQFRSDYYNTKEQDTFKLSPPQRFCGQFISNQTDFPGLLIYHGLGSGKTITSIIIAESIKGKYINDGITFDINGRKFNDKYCSVTIVVPVNIIDQYISDIVGEGTKNCIIYSDADGKGYKQEYINKSSINNFYGQINRHHNKINELKSKLKGFKSESDSNEIIIINNKIEEEQSKIKYLNKEIDKLKESSVTEIYFIVSVDTFISRLKDKIITDSNFTYDIKSGDSSKGKYFEVDCFHSKKSLIIIDEVQKVSNSETTSYKTLFNTLYKYARNTETGQKTMRIVLLTATPVYDNPFQLASIMNLLRPRVLFPLISEDFNKCFLTDDKKDIKNKILLKYMFSGYVSYFKGGNPYNYPYRRNNVIYHAMSSHQITQYNQYLNMTHVNFNDEDDDKDKISPVYLAASFYIQNNNGLVKNDLDPLFEYYKQCKKMEMDDFLSDFKARSTKMYWLCNTVINGIGVKYINAPSTTRHMLTIALYLLKHGYEYLSVNDTVAGIENVDKKKRFVIYSGTLAMDYNLHEYLQIFNQRVNSKNNCDHTKHKNELFNFMKSDENINGEYCQIIIGDIEEGVSFKFISQIHICTPWWNKSRIDQVVGRGIRINSHTLLPKNKQVVDVYYHISYIPHNKSSLNARLKTIDEIRYKRTFEKSKLNKKFEKLLKESAIDYDLNYNGNLTRLDEYTFIINDGKSGKNGKIGIYGDETSDEFYTLTNELKFKQVEVEFKDETIDITNLRHTITPIKYDITIDYSGREMISALFNETYKSDLHNTEINNYNFLELKKYAIENKHEESDAWNLVYKLMVKDKILDALLSNGVLLSTKKQIELINTFVTYVEKFESEEVKNKIKNELGIKDKDKKKR